MTKPIFKVGRYGVFHEQDEFVVRVSDCEICEGPCKVSELSASKSDIKKILNRRLDEIAGYSVKLYPRTVKVGCTRIEKSKLERLLK